MQIRNEKEMVVSAPYFTSDSEIVRFVEKKQPWINRVIRRQQDVARKIGIKSFENGDPFLYLGETYPLEVFFKPFETEGLTLRNRRFYLNTREDSTFRKHCFIAWYKRKASDFIRQRVDVYSKMLNLPYKGFRITSARSRWGSCTRDDRLAFSYRLIMAPPEIIDYVIVHELAHVRQKNHAAAFWKIVGDVIPGYPTHRRWLRENQHRFDL